MAFKQDPGIASGDAVLLDELNFAEIVKGLPAKARMVLLAAMNLPRGSLKVRMPDGRAVLVGGKAPGPDAELVLKNWRLPGRAFSGGTIGLAESYMDGDWDSPDVTSFLELFVVNSALGEKVAGGANWLINTVQRIRHWFNENTRTGSKRNIS
ncbi:MAG: SAM-dependent methyltransferase, partial [Mesorhizobium sp.]